MTSAKALRVGAVMGNREFFPKEPGVVSSTWGGGALACAVGARTIDIIRDENLRLNVAEKEKSLLKGLMRLEERHRAIGNSRALGLLAAFDLKTQEMRDALIQASFRRGLLTLGCGERTVRLLPPLNVRDREIEMAIRVLDQGLEDIERDY
jgi:4-aminobutyrate aminotransferase